MSNTARTTDTLGASLAARFAATLDVAPGAKGEAAPAGIHWCLGAPETPTAGLGEDGHSQAGGFLPDLGLPRRMWAASAVTFHSPIAIGAAVERTSRIAAVERKEGRSGPLGLVEVAHETRADGSLAVSEVQTLVYRGQQGGTAALPPVRPFASDWPWHREIGPDAVLLQRFSALTFNSHRIHYDLPYAREVENYPGLVVHGPLMAVLLLDLARRELGGDRLERFAFRAKSPAFAGQPLHLVGRRDGPLVTLQALGGDGRLVVDATARIAAD